MSGANPVLSRQVKGAIVGKRKPAKLKMALDSRRSLIKQATDLQRELRAVQAELHKLVIEKRRTECVTFHPVDES